jgi:hypothetical protein
MALYHNNKKISRVFQGSNEINKIYQDSKLVYGKNTYDPYTIEFEINSSSGTFIVPFSQVAASNQVYSYNVYVNDVLYGTATGRTNPNGGTGYQINGLTGNTAVIKLTPVNEIGNVVGWGRSFGFHVNELGANALANKNKLLRVLNDPDYAHLVSETNIGINFRCAQYYKCQNLTQTVDESMPDTVTGNIDVGFRYQQYYQCTKLRGVVPTEVLPSSGTYTISSDFRAHQYYACSGLTGSAAVEVLPDTVREIHHAFRYQQYAHCTGLTQTAAEVLPSGVRYIGLYFRGGQYSYCTGLTQTAVEVLPSGITGDTGGYFRYEQYLNCPNIRISGHTHSYQFATLLNEGYWDEENYFTDYGNYYGMFYLSSGIANTTPDDVPRYYTNITETTTAPITNLYVVLGKAYLTNRTGVANYNTIDNNWKAS